MATFHYLKQEEANKITCANEMLYQAHRRIKVDFVIIRSKLRLDIFIFENFLKFGQTTCEENTCYLHSIIFVITRCG